MKKKRLKIGRILVLLAVVIVIIVASIMLLSNGKKKNKVEVIDKLEEYGYTLDDNETKYYNELFKELKTTLNEKPVDEELYAEILCKLFVSDFFNLDNKNSNSDIGGVQYVYKGFQGDFVKQAKEKIYHSVKSNLYGERKQELPIVKNVEISSIEDAEYTYFEEYDSEAYLVKLSIEYEKDLGYQTTASIYLVHSENKLEIVEMKK